MRSRPACAGPPTRTSSVESGARTGRCGRPRARRRSRTASAGWTSPSVEREQLADSRRCRGAAWPRATATRSCSGMGGSSLAPEVFRQSFGKLDAGLTLHVLDSTHPQQVREVLEQHRPRPSADDRLVASPAGRSSRCRCSRPSRARQGDGSHFVAVTDPGSSLEDARRRARLPRGLPRRPGHRRALQRAVARSGSSPPRRRASTSPAVLDSAIGAAEECRGEQRQRRPVARLRARRARPPGPRQAHLRRRRAADSATASGPSSCSPSRPASSARGILPIADEPLLAPEAYGEDRVFLHIALGDAREREQAGRAQGRRPPGDHDPRARPHRPRPDLLPVGVRGRRRRLGAGDQPVRPAQRPRGQGQHQPGAQGGFRRASKRAA